MALDASSINTPKTPHSAGKKRVLKLTSTASKGYSATDVEITQFKQIAKGRPQAPSQDVCDVLPRPTLCMKLLRSLADEKEAGQGSARPRTSRP